MKATTIRFLLLALMALVSGANATVLERYSYTNLNIELPDGSLSGVSDTRTIASSITKLSAVRVRLNVAGRFNGDLYAYVRHVNGDGTSFCVLLNRPGKTSSNVAGYSDAGLDVTLDSAAANDIHLYRNYSSPPAGTPLTGTWQPDGRKVSPLTVLDTSTRGSSLTSFNGLPASGEWTLFVADVDSGATNKLVSWELELVGAIAPTITWANPSAIFYGTALSGTQLNATSGGVAGTFVYSPSAGTILNAGLNQTLSVTFTPTDTVNYTPVTATAKINVFRASLTVAAANTNRFYGDANPAFTGTITGIKNGEDITATYACSAVPASAVGGYPIVPTAVGATLSNYNVTLQNGTLTVDAAALTVAASNTNRFYGDANPVFKGTITGVKNGETITATYACSAGPTSAIGGYPITPTPAGATLGNYAVTVQNGTLTVNAAALVVAAGNTNRIYGDANPVFKGTITGVKNGETITATYATTATATSPVGNYSIVPTPAGTTLGNYAVTLQNGTLTVGQAALTVTASNTNRFYGDANPVFKGTITGIKNSEAITATYACSAVPTSAVGSYAIVPTPSGTTLGNYAVTLQNGTLAVDAAALTVVAGNTNRPYGDPNPVFKGTITGIKNGETITANYACGAAPTSPVGSYAIVPSAVGTTLSNYDVTLQNGTLTVGTATLNVTAADTNRFYGDANPVFKGTITGIKNSESITATYACSAVPASAVGGYAIVPTPAGATLGNYTVTLQNGTLTVDAAALTVAAANTNRIYGDANPVFKGTVTGAKNGETITATYACSATAASPIGGYAIVPSPSGATLGNYDVTLQNGTLTVGAAALTVTAGDTNRFYGDANPVFKGTITGIKNSEAITATYACAAVPASPIGDYAIVPTASGATLGNYTVTRQNGILTVDAAALIVAAGNTNRIYGDANPVFKGTITGIKNSEAITATYTCGAVATSSIGGYAIVPTPSGTTLGNYTVTLQNGTLTVSQAALTVAANNANRIYGRPNPTFTGSITGIKNSEAITATYSCSATLVSPVGSYAIVPTPAGATLGNYSVTPVNGTLTIDRSGSSGIVSASNNPQLPGQAVILSVTLSPVAPSVGTPSGTVQFRIDGAAAGSPVALVSGAASYSTSTLSVGTHTVVAEYAGDNNFTGTSSTLTPALLINTPPVAGPDFIDRYPTNGTKVEIATLLANDSDADGDTVVLNSVSSTSANGASITLEGNWITYHAPAGFTNVDTFTYTISDGRGAPVTGTVTIQPKSVDGPALNLTITDLGSGTYRLRFDGIPDRSTVVQYTTTLNPPNWQTLTNGTSDSVGIFECTDSPSGGIGSRYYRALYP